MTINSWRSNERLVKSLGAQSLEPVSQSEERHLQSDRNAQSDTPGRDNAAHGVEHDEVLRPFGRADTEFSFESELFYD